MDHDDRKELAKQAKRQTIDVQRVKHDKYVTKQDLVVYVVIAIIVGWIAYQVGTNHSPDTGVPSQCVYDSSEC